MECKKDGCSGKLEVHRTCRQVRMRCTRCGQLYQIHEVAADLDDQAEELLARYTSIVYD